MGKWTFQSEYHVEFAPEEIEIIIRFGTDNLHQNKKMRHGEYLKSLTEQDIENLADRRKPLPDIDLVWLLDEVSMPFLGMNEAFYGKFDAPAEWHDYKTRQWEKSSEPPLIPGEPQYTRLSGNRINELDIAFPGFAEWYKASHDDYGTYVGRDGIALMKQQADKEKQGE